MGEITNTRLYHRRIEYVYLLICCTCFILFQHAILISSAFSPLQRSHHVVRLHRPSREIQQRKSFPHVGKRGSLELAGAGDENVFKSDILDTLQDKFEYQGRLIRQDPNYRCGYVTLIGAANMGKSTLLNALLQETLCTTTHRPQTTRHSILGVLTSEEESCQLCFTDTPGVIEDPAYKLQDGMMEAVKGAFKNSDVILIITDLFSTPIPDDVLFQRISASKKKKIVVINKIDLADKVNPNSDGKIQYHNLKDQDIEEIEDGQILYKRTVSVAEAVRNWREIVPDALAIVPMVASNGGTDSGVVALRTLLLGGPDVPKAFRDLGRPIQGMFQPGVKFIDNKESRKIIPNGPPLYDTETLTDRSER